MSEHSSAPTAATPFARRTDLDVDELADAYARTGDRRFRDELVDRLTGLADAIAASYAGRGEPLDDLRQVARLGLLRAAERFDPDAGAIAAFAAATVRGDLRRHFRDASWTVHVPRRIQELLPRVRRAADELQQRRGQAPTVDEIARWLRVPRAHVLEAYAAGTAHRTVPLERHDQPDEWDACRQVERDRDLQAALDTLGERDRELLRLRYVEELTQSVIARDLGISQVQVSRLLTRATDRMRGVLGPR